MRELERVSPSPAHERASSAVDLVIVGAGRAGGALAAAAEAAGLSVGLEGRGGADPLESPVVLLCVPDDALAAACESLLPRLAPGAAVGHVSGAHDLSALAAASRAEHATFSIHPLMTIPDSDASLTGVPCAVSGADPPSLRIATDLARRLGMEWFEIPDSHRATYHAAASIASNFLIALEESAAELLSQAGVEDARDLLSPLVLRTAANWSDRGGAALTGPIARGDEATVERHRTAIRDHAPHLLRLYDSLADATRAISPQPAVPGPGISTVARTRTELDDLLRPHRDAGRTIGLVPTMGFLHEGHLSLIRAAAEVNDVIVMSLFVNPTQFGAGEDLDSYPRDEARDLELAAEAGADIVFSPPADEVYRPGFATAVSVEGLTDVLCGDPARRGAEHFRGVTTVVAKLLNMVRPDAAYFGQKDAQQAVVIRRMADDLDFPARIEVLPTVREPDGLAMSSRNAYLTSDERARAVALSRALRAAEAAAASGATDAKTLIDAARAELDAAGIEPEYLEARDAEDLTEVGALDRRPVLLALAARVGRARLIDNAIITPSDRST